MTRSDVEKAVRAFFQEMEETPTEETIQQRVDERLARLNAPKPEKPQKPKRIESANQSFFRQL